MFPAHFTEGRITSTFHFLTELSFSANFYDADANHKYVNKDIVMMRASTLRIYAGALRSFLKR
jgi:hypothetical protein